MQKKGRESSDSRPHHMQRNAAISPQGEQTVLRHGVSSSTSFRPARGTAALPSLFQPRRRILVDRKPENSVLSVEITENQESVILDECFSKRQENYVDSGRRGSNVRFLET